MLIKNADKIVLKLGEEQKRVFNVKVGNLIVTQGPITS